MRRLFRWLFRLLILGIVLLVALVLLKDTLLKALAEWRIRQATGMSVTIEKLEMGLFSPTFTMEGLKLYNTPEFGGSVCLDVPSVYLEYDPRDALSGKIHLRLLRVNVRELDLVRNQAGLTNFVSLVATNTARPATMPVTSAAKSRVEYGGIDRLYLTAGAVHYADLAHPASNWVRTLAWKDHEATALRTMDDFKNWGLLTFLQIVVTSPTPWPAPKPLRK